MRKLVMGTIGRKAGLIPDDSIAGDEAYADADIDDLEDNTPDSSIARKDASPDISLIPGAKLGMQAPPSDQGKMMAPQVPAQQPQGDPANALLADYNKGEDRLRAGQLATDKSNLDVNLGRVFANLARGGQAPLDQSGLYDSLAKQNEAAQGREAGALGRRAAVTKAIEQARLGQGKLDQGDTKIDNQKEKNDAYLEEMKRYHDLIGNRTGQSMDFKQQALDQRTHNQVVARLVNDKNVAQRVTQYNNLDNAINNLTANPITPEAIHEFQQTVRSNMGIKGGGGVGEREATYMNSLGLRGEKWLEMLTGNPADIAKDNKMVQHFIKMAQSEQSNISAQKDKRIEAATAGQKSLYDRRPDLKGDLDDAVSKSQAQFQSTQAPAAFPKTVTNGSHTATVSNQQEADQAAAKGFH